MSQSFFSHYGKVHFPTRLKKNVGTAVVGEDEDSLIGYSPEMMKETWQV